MIKYFERIRWEKPHCFWVAMTYGHCMKTPKISKQEIIIFTGGDFNICSLACEYRCIPHIYIFLFPIFLKYIVRLRASIQKTKPVLWLVLLVNQPLHVGAHSPNSPSFLVHLFTCCTDLCHFVQQSNLFNNPVNTGHFAVIGMDKFQDWAQN